MATLSQGAFAPGGAAPCVPAGLANARISSPRSQYTRLCHPEIMADPARRLPENVPGPFFVDATCIDCDTCRQLAPATFGETGETSFVQLQPRNPEEHRAALRALISCPTASIGAPDKGAIVAALSDFPLPVAPNVYYCGFNS